MKIKDLKNAISESDMSLKEKEFINIYLIVDGKIKDYSVYSGDNK